MNGYLKQSTASQVRAIGPFVDDTDFKTLETALTIANTDVKLKKNGGTAASKNSGGATADSTTGMYHLTWDATDTNTVGELSVSIKISGALVYFCNYTVLEEVVYDMLFGASATGFISDITRSSQTSVDTLATYVDTEVAAIKTKTDQLPANTTTEFATLNTKLNTIDDFVDTEVAAIKVTTDKLDTALELDGAVYRYTANALELAPISGSTGNGGTLRFDDIWKWTTAGSVSSGQIRGNVTDWNIITELWIHNVTNGTTNLSAYLRVIKADDTVRVQQENNPAIWNSYLVTGAVVDMTTWVKIPVTLRAGASASPPATATNCLVSVFRPNNLDWSDAEREQIRHRIGIDGTATAPAATPSLALQTTSTSIKTVTDKVDTALVVDGAVYQYTANALELGPAGGGGGSGDASQATLLAVKAKTDALPSDPADASDIAASFATVNGTLSTISGYVDTEVAAIKAKTDNLPTDPADASDIAASFTTVNTKLDAIASGAPLDATELNAIADALLKRDWTAVTGEASYSVLQALRMLRNVWNTTGGTLSVKKEDGTTNAWTRVLSTDAAADPIIGAS